MKESIEGGTEELMILLEKKDYTNMKYGLVLKRNMGKAVLWGGTMYGLLLFLLSLLSRDYWFAVGC